MGANSQESDEAAKLELTYSTTASISRAEQPLDTLIVCIIQVERNFISVRNQNRERKSGNKPSAREHRRRRQSIAVGSSGVQFHRRHLKSRILRRLPACLRNINQTDNRGHSQREHSGARQQQLPSASRSIHLKIRHDLLDSFSQIRLCHCRHWAAATPHAACSAESHLPMPRAGSACAMLLHRLDEHLNRSGRVSFPRASPGDQPPGIHEALCRLPPSGQAAVALR